MPIPFESEARFGNQHLFLRGVASLLVCAVIVGLLIAKSNGDLDDRVEAVVALSEVGDGLPIRSDVKFRGVLVGSVAGVTPAVGDGLNVIDVDLHPTHAREIPQTVTARVVPGNVFAVSSIELIDNGPGAAIDDGFRIPQDSGADTVQFQVALTKLRDIVGAVSRGRDDSTIGIITALAEATDRRGADIVEAGHELQRLVDETNALMAPTGEPSTVQTFSRAIRALEQSAPDLVDAVHNSVLPMRTIVEKQVALSDFIGAAGTTLGTTATAMNNNTDRMINISTKLTPVIGVMADNAPAFVPITTRIKVVGDKFMTEVYNPETGLAQSKMILSLSPNTVYTRADCPRYGDLEGPSCSTAPAVAAPQAPMPDSLNPAKYQLPPGYSLPAGYIGGNVGPVGSATERDLIRKLIGADATTAAQILLAPVLRGNTVTVSPDTEGGR